MECGEKTWPYMCVGNMYLKIPSENYIDDPPTSGKTDSILCLRVR